MAFRPGDISREHVLEAIDKIEKEGIALNKPTKHYVIIKGKAYPPIEVMRYTYKMASGGKEWTYNGGDATNNFLRKLNFKIINKGDFHMMGFKDTIADLKSALENDATTKNLFTFSKPGQDFVWIGDCHKIIGNDVAHYEISFGKTDNKYDVDIHFESKEKSLKTQFYPLFDNLPPNIETFPWFKAKSLRYCNGVEQGDPNLIDELKTRLLYLESELGDKIRDIMNSNKIKVDSMTQLPLNQILFGPPGTGKTYNSINLALKITGENIDGKSRNEVKNAFDKKITEGQIIFTTFHQSMSYEDFIEGIKPVAPTGESGAITYKVQDGIFKKICSEARQIKREKVKIDNEELDLTRELFREFYDQFASVLGSVDEDKSTVTLYTASGKAFGLYRNSAGTITVKAGMKKTKMSASYEQLSSVLFDNKPPTYASYERIIIDKILENTSYSEEIIDNTKNNYVLIIDEINRGNVSSIFGELITLIEEDKRLGKAEALEVVLPYSKERFGIPSNLYIIGTMNTADRSVEALDTALRRRFSFEIMKPAPDLIASNGKLNHLSGVVNGVSLPNLLDVINQRIEKLLDADHQIGHSYFMAVENINDLKVVFQNKIIPLLQEYFFGDYGKIGLVLGEGFVSKSSESKRSIFAKFDGYDFEEYEDRIIYHVFNVLEMDETTFNNAINFLLNQP